MTLSGRRSPGTDEKIDFREVADPDFEQRGICEDLGIDGAFGNSGEFTLGLKFLDREHIEGDGILAEAQLTQHGRVVQVGAFLALILADEGVHDVQNHAIPEFRQGEEFRNGCCHALCGCFEPDRVVDAAEGQPEKISGDPGEIVIEERRDVDDLRDFPGQEF